MTSATPEEIVRYGLAIHGMEYGSWREPLRPDLHKPLGHQARLVLAVVQLAERHPTLADLQDEWNRRAEDFRGRYAASLRKAPDLIVKGLDISKLEIKL